MFTLLFAALLGCNGAQQGDRNDDTATNPFEKSGTLIGKTTIDGAPVDSDIWITGDDISLTQPTGSKIKVPAQMMLDVMAGSDNVGKDCEETARPLYAHTDDTLWTYETQSVEVDEDEVLEVTVPLNRYIFGRFTFVVETWYFNEDTGEYDVSAGEPEVIDKPSLISMSEGKWILVPDMGDEIAGIGAGGRYYTTGSQLVYEPKDEEHNGYIEESRIEKDTFWFRLYLEDFKVNEVTATRVADANCSAE